MKQYSSLSFNNQVFFIGIDVHKKNWRVSIRALNMELETFTMDPTPEQLAVHLQRKYPGGSYKAVYEAGFCGFWVQRKLSAMGVDCIVVSPADVPTTNKEKLSKTDSLDSRKLARELELGRLRSIHVPKLEDQTLRSLCRLRHSLVKDSSRLKNRIKSFLHLYGYRMSKDAGSHWSRKYIKELETISIKLPGGETLQCLTECLKQLRPQVTSCTIKLRKSLREKGKMDTVFLLMTVPGVGFITAATLVCEIIDIARFPSFDHLASFVGLIPTMSNSGEKEISREITPRGNSFLSHKLIESAWVAVRRDPAMLIKYHKLLIRMKGNKAIVRIAKKLLSRINGVWKKNCPYLLATV